MNFERTSSSSSSSNPLDDTSSLSGSFKEDSGFVGSFKEDSPVKRHSSHNPTVAAMLRSNMMRDCGQVREMYNHCIDSKAESTICNTAKHYFASCATAGK